MKQQLLGQNIYNIILVKYNHDDVPLYLYKIER
jgi:hypothetical protein